MFIKITDWRAGDVSSSLNNRGIKRQQESGDCHAGMMFMCFLYVDIFS